MTKIALLIGVIVALCAYGDFEMRVTRIPVICVTLTNGVLSCVTTGVEYRFSRNLDGGVYQDSYRYDSLAECMANPVMVTNDLRYRCQKLGWDVQSAISIMFTGLPPIAVTNEVAR